MSQRIAGLLSIITLAVAFSLAPVPSVAVAADQPLVFPVLVPVTGFLSLEGTSQRNGALMAINDPPAGVAVRADVVDTGTAPEGAVTALERAASGGGVGAVVASMLGTQMLAMLPLALEFKVPLITVSGTASITEQGNPWVFRFFPGDAVTKWAHARYVVENLGHSRPALITQTTAYGQSGRAQLLAQFRRLGAEPVFDEAVDAGVKDLLPVIVKALAAHPDVLVLHLHSAPTALFIRQAVAQGVNLPIVAGSAMHQPSTAALLEPGELKGVCAETAASPVSGGSPAMERFTASYRAAFGAAPDAFALAQYDGMRMVLDAVAGGARGPDDIRAALAGGSHDGLAMTYRSDGKGNMAHSALIVCYDGVSRVPRIVRRFEDPAFAPTPAPAPSPVSAPTIRP
jgi:branched-chain amino acid transport system substrate-binding protein